MMAVRTGSLQAMRMREPDMPTAEQGALLTQQWHARRGRAFTLVELLVTVAIIAILIGVSSFAIQGMRKGNMAAQAKNAILAYTTVARNYAVANRVETMLVINPYNGLFELWHLNPPAQGGPWDPYSEQFPDGYVFANVLDGGARLPTDGNNKPLVAVHPIDFAEPGRPHAPDERNVDNLTWVAFCFDENGKMVTRTRRIATRSYRYRNGDLRPNRNRTDAEKPDLSLVQTLGWLVDQNDTAITSTLGFIISDRNRMEDYLGKNPTPAQIADPAVGWLVELRPGRPFSQFGETVALDRFTGQMVAGDK